MNGNLKTESEGRGRQVARLAGWRLVVLVVSTAVWIQAWRYHPRIMVEHGPMENFQAACLAAGMLVLGWVAFKTSDLAQRTLYFGIVVLFLTFLLVEYDTRSFGNEWLILLFNGPIRNGFLALLWIAAFALFYRRWRAILAFFAKWILTPAGVSLAISGMLWVAGGAVDKLRPFDERNMNLMGEELAEVNAALLMLWAALDCRISPVET